MNPNLVTAIQITVVGMGLVFAAIVLLWGLMAGLVRVTADKPAPATAEASEKITDNKKRRAAIAAVAVALATERQPGRPVAVPPTATVSAWQAAMRANRLKLRGPVR